MNISPRDMRARSAAAALGSVRAEGLQPSVETERLIALWVEGKITTEELRETVLKAVLARNEG